MFLQILHYSGSMDVLESIYRASGSSKKTSRRSMYEFYWDIFLNREYFILIRYHPYYCYSRNNVLMELRKCLQHPYLVEEALENQKISAKEAHQRLVDASAKLSLLQKLLTQLREKGHRVLIFSQFVINLDILQSFLEGEGIQYVIHNFSL